MRPAPLLLAPLLLLGACDLSMERQNKLKTYGATAIWPSGAEARDLPEGVVARTTEATRPMLTAELLARGRERYDIFCAPCHGLGGDGDGVIVKRGFPAPPAFSTDRVRQDSATQLYGAISQGYGAMYGFASRIPPRDRWALVAYVRALQLAGRSPLAQAPEAGDKSP